MLQVDCKLPPFPRLLTLSTRAGAQTGKESQRQSLTRKWGEPAGREGMSAWQIGKRCETKVGCVVKPRGSGDLGLIPSPATTSVCDFGVPVKMGAVVLLLSV